MPKIPTYQPGQVGPVETTQARFRAPDMAPSGLGQGLQALGDATARYAQVQDAINAQNDDTQSRKAALEGQAQASAITQEFSALQGGNARAGQQAAMEKLAKVRDGLLASASNGRMARMIEERFGPIFVQANESIAGHALGQSQVERKGVLLSAVGAAQDEAATLYEHPDAFAPALDKVKSAAAEYAQFAGYGEASGSYIKEQSGKVYASAVLNALHSDKVDLAQAMFDAHSGDMTFDQRNQVFAALQKPLLERDSAAGFTEITSGYKPQPPSAGGEKFAAPVDGHVTSHFGEQRGAEKHMGLDIAASLGSAVHPIAGGTVIGVDDDPRSGKFVRVRHSDGHVSSYSHLANQSVKVGDEVNSDTVLGTVGMTGHTTGPHVHLRVKDASGADVDPKKLIGRALAPSVVGSPSAPRNWDQGQVISAIDNRTDWTFEKRERVKDYARKRMAQDESMLSDQYSDALDQANLFIAQHGGVLGSASELPASVRNSMNPTKLAELDLQLRKSAADALDKVRSDALANSKEAIDLEVLRRNPQQFERADLSAYNGKVPPEKWSSAVLEQYQLRNRSAVERAKFDPTTGIDSAMSRAKRFQKIQVSDKDYPAVFDTMKARIADVYEKKGGIVTAADYDEAFKDAYREIPARWSRFGGSTTMRVYEADAAMSDTDRARLTDAFKRANHGRAPDDTELLQMYRRQRGR